MSQIKLRVWGEFACFTRPEFKTERVSYSVITPSAARGIFESIYWHPGVTWVITRIHIIKSGRSMSMKRNELKYKLDMKPKHRNPSDNRAQRNTLLLRDVEYVIEASVQAPTIKDVGKSLNIFRKRAVKGRPYKQPYFGCKEYVANYELTTDVDIATTLRGESPLGFMFFGWDFAGETPSPIFFDATMLDGVIQVPLAASLRR